jgi:hypothetical protein
MSKEYGADYIHFAPGMTLRDNQRSYFLKKINEKYPELFPKYKELYENEMHANHQYIQQKNSKLAKLCKKYKINMRLKRWIPKDFRKLNYLIAEKLLNESYFNQIEGKSYSKLQWAGLSINNLKKSIMEYYNVGKIQEIENMTPALLSKIRPWLKQKGTLEDYF